LHAPTLVCRSERFVGYLSWERQHIQLPGILQQAVVLRMAIITVEGPDPCKLLGRGVWQFCSSILGTRG